MTLADTLCKTAAQNNKLLVEVLAGCQTEAKRGHFFIDIEDEWFKDPLWLEVKLYLEKCGFRIVMNTSTRYISNVGPRIYWV